MKKKRLSDYWIREIIKHFVLDVNATQTAGLLGMSRLTINRYYREFRELIAQQREAGKGLLRGKIEVDESYFGASRPGGAPKPLKLGRGTLKQPVFGNFECDGPVYTEKVPDCKKATLQTIIVGDVSLGNGQHINGIESFWRFTKRRLRHFNGIAKPVFYLLALDEHAH